jgi:hypothetical protein
VLYFIDPPYVETKRKADPSRSSDCVKTLLPFST